MRPRLVWAIGVAVFVLALLAALQVALALPLGYDLRAYWLAARNMLAGAPIYPAPDARLGQSGEFHYLPMVVIPFFLLAPLSLEAARVVWLVLEIAMAAAVGVFLIRPSPSTARPWAAAAFVFFLPLVLEVVLGNLNLASLGLALLAWHWRERRMLGPLALAAAVGLKFFPLTLLPFYLAAGRWRMVARAVLFGAIAFVISLPFLWQPMLDFLALLPRYLETEWVRLIVDREEPAWLAAIFWSAWFPMLLSGGTLVAALACGRMARRDPDRDEPWHHVALALTPYIASFGFIWTTFLIAALPLFALALRRSLRLRSRSGVAAVVGLTACYAAMEIVQLHDLYPILVHLAAVLALVGIALVLITQSARQALGRSTPASRATSSASG